MTVKEASELQEKEIAKLLNGRTQSNSGGTRFGGGDIHTNNFLIEAKTTIKDRLSFPIKKEWIHKSSEQAFQQGKNYSALAFRFNEKGEDYFVINSQLFSQLVQFMEEENNE